MRRHHHHIRGRSAPKGLLGMSACAGALVLASSAHAQQNDVNPPLPDVMLLLDTSGSMELMMDGCNPDTGKYPDGSGLGTTGSPTWCNGPVPTPAGGPWCDGITPRPMNRWEAQVAALTGSYPGANGSVACVDESRTPGSNTPFVTEYSMKYGGGNAPPYDANYFLDYHRPAEAISGTKTCVIGFNQTTWSPDGSFTHPATQADFNSANISGYQLDTSASVPVADPTKSCSFQQNSDGIINIGTGSIRFGLMTFDNDTLPGTGVTGSFAAGFTDVSLLTPPTAGMWSYYNGWLSPPTGASIGRPAGCATAEDPLLIPFEVGARNPAAPPWEGRMMQFPTDPNDTTGATTNQQIISAIRAMRPYGANPIAGMLDDAKYYFWQDPQGPALADPLASCRKQYIILLSHAAPNLDLQTYCQGTAGGYVGVCPYDYPEYIAGGLRQGTYTQGGGVVNAKSANASGPSVLTYVVGFVPSSDLGGTSTQKCSDVVDTSTSPATIKSAYCGTEMLNGVDAGAGGIPAYASCCALARIAAAGGTGAPLFADNATDLGTALQTILSLIVANETTRATPVVLPQTANSSSAGGAASATFISSFSVSTAAPWSGNVQRERAVCSSSGGVWGPQLGTPPIDLTKGDDFQHNLNAASQAGTPRNVLVVEPNPSVTTVPAPGAGRVATGNIRPWINGTSTPSTTATGVALDNYSEYDSEEYAYTYTPGGAGPAISTTEVTTDALGLTGLPTANCSFTAPIQKAPFTNSDCETLLFNYMLGLSAPATWTADTTGAFPGRTGTTASPFGAVYHSTPVVATPPSSLLRDDSYQNFINEYSVNYATGPNGNAEPRHTVLYVATLDGLLHAFGVDYSSNDNYSYNGTNNDSAAGTSGTMNEMWSFIPPAVMPKLMGSTGPSATSHLDGAPVVKDTVYARSAVSAASDWHTSLVAGFGKGGPGYYALDVTDPDFCRRNSSNKCTAGSSSQGTKNPSHGSANSGTPPYMSSGLPGGPHFLWQLTFQSPKTDLTASTLTALGAVTDDTSVNLFAANSVTPAITTVYIHDPDDGVLREIGVAILPGGAATAPAVTSAACARSTKVTDASPTGYDFDSTFAARQWGTTCSSPVAGRSLTIVRLDNGEVLRTFVQPADHTSSFALYGASNNSAAGGTGGGSTNGHGYAIQGRVTEADFDSPMSGTPVPYPSDVGAIAQKAFIGDQDGVIWRLDLSSPVPTEWFVEPFIDAFNAQIYKDAGTPAAAVWAASRQPISGAPNVTIGLDGHLVLNFGTGDLNNIGTSHVQNYVYSVSEKSNATSSSVGTRLVASVNWYGGTKLLQAGEMITGPATVFDGVYYFATYAPPTSLGTCAVGGASLWGMDFVHPNGTSTTPDSGGLPEMVTTSGTAQSVAQGTAIIPGVSITSTAVCAATTTGVDPVSGGTSVSLSNVAPAQYSITALVGASATSASATGGTNTGAAVKTATYTIANGVHTSTLVDSWASIVE